MLGSIASAVAGLAGSAISHFSNTANAKRNIQLQKDFAQQGIRWKVADAKAAGIHPIYALGAPTHSFSPVSIGDSLGTGIRQAGQDIGRAINSTSSPTQRLDAFGQAAQALSLEKGGLENELLRSQIARMRQTTNPALPDGTDPYMIGGQGNAAIKDQPLKRTPSGLDPSTEPGAITDIGWSRTKGGGWMPVPSKDTKERIEDIAPHEWAHYIRNNIVPMISSGRMNPPPVPLQSGYRWSYNPIDGYTQVRVQRSLNWFGK